MCAVEDTPVIVPTTAGGGLTALFGHLFCLLKAVQVVRVRHVS